MGHRDGFTPGRSESIGTTIGQALRDERGAILSAAGFAQQTWHPLSQVAYAFLRLEQAGRIKRIGTVARGGARLERLYQLGRRGTPGDGR